MGQPGIHAGWTRAVCALVLSAALGCGGGSSPAPPPAGPPVPAERGTPVGAGARKIVGAAGGYVTSSDGVLNVSVPAGALSSDVDLTIEVITNTAPSAVGNAYRIAIAPAGTVLAAPIALVFTPGSSAPLADLSVAWQDATGFWVRQQSVTRDATAGTLTVTTTTLGDWAVVGLPNGRDLIGIFHVESTAGRLPVVADGKSAINFHAGDLTTGWYIQSGKITAASPIVAGAQTCTPNAPTMSLAPNVAEVLANPARFRWGVDGHWDLTCSPPGTDFAYLSVDTTGIGYLGCTRTYLETPLVTPQKLLGRYKIDCGTGGTITANWQFEFCDLGKVCTSTNQCHTASITCDTGLPLCVDDGNVPNGTSCDLVASVNEVCGDGVCNVCRIGEACTPIGNVCHVGKYTCDTGFEVCTDQVPTLGSAAYVPNGTTCDVDPLQPEVCGNGTCNACTVGKSCATNPNKCVAGTTTCNTGFEICVDTATPIAPGTVCDVNPLVDEVCNGAGACIACTAALACSTNPNPCVTGVTSCATGAQTCENTTTPIAAGTACNVDPLVDEVCNGAGACIACTANLPCAYNPNKCVSGVTSCTTGAEACLDTTTPIPNGTTCDVDPLVPEVCSNGICNACTAGNACATNPNRCFTGTTSCTTGVETCVDATQLANGTTCGTNMVCNAGTCVSCTAGLACASNSNPCVAGVTSCSTGTQTCENTATPIAAGTVCNVDPLVDEVCNGAGACVACTAGLTCTTNPDPLCNLGVTSCSTGASVCLDAADRPNGTSCGTNMVCSAGACTSCTADLACSTNPDPCLTGITSCSTGTQLCVDNAAAPEPNGTACGTNLVCSAGACVSCTADLACTTNPDPLCNLGVTSCSTGSSQCIDGANRPNGTSCGTNLVCSEGGCISCTAGLACATNPDPCLAGVTSCSTGTQTCVDDAAAPEPNGTACGSNLVCNAGVCVSCTAGLACATNPDTLCNEGITSCATGTSVCVDGADRPNGTSCGTNMVCSAGACTACTAGLACTGNPNPCVAGTTSCATGTQTCVDTSTWIANGTSCGTNLVCNAGACVSCTAGLACTTNPDPLCNVGVTSCATGTSMCVDGADRPNGTSCGTNLVCSAGVCASCTAGLSCNTNPDPCLTGVTSCGTGTQTCVDNTAAPEPNGTACGTNLVCSAGACVSCTAGLACTTNPDPLCNDGVTSCTTGASVCVDGAAKADGTSCGTDMVCSAGACTSCTEGLACVGNPDPLCHDGVTSCATGTSVCVDGAAKVNGTTCGSGMVCNAGLCTSCTAGVACATNPDPLCNLGVTSCSTGTSVCVDGADRANGTSCGTNLVCNAGACVSCVANAACTTNPDPACNEGITSCTTGTSVCVDGANRPNGTSCDVDPMVTEVCNAGACVACAEGAACSTNPAPCLQGTTSCSTGTPVCTDTATPEPNGTSCGTNQVCNAGACLSCTAGLACTTNPDPLCNAGVTSCATGTQTCVDGADKANGTSCGTNMVCNAGTCTSCTEGLACTTNPDPLCNEGVTSCSTGTSVCLDGAAKADGTSCGTDMVCSAGVCGSCTAGLACATNPDPCLGGITSCSTGTQTCVDNPLAREPDGMACGTNMVCSAGVCSSCVAGLSCTGNPNACVTGVTSCSTGTSVCVDSSTVLANGTSCGTNLVCSAGVCTSCTAGLACTTNPDPLCNLGVTSCSTGTSVCVDGAAKADGTSCGTNLVCSAGACTPCTAGLACATNADPCLTGTTSCSTGTSVCIDNTAAPEPNGTVCGTGQVCNAGVCTSCTAGAACATNPDPCLTGTTSCNTGTSVCVDNTAAPEPNGTACGTNLVCSAGVCTSCTAGLACATNPDPCLTGTTSCSTGTSVCVDNTAIPEPNGTTCGTNLVCNAGVCTPCTAGAACAANPNPCLAGTTSCSTGAQTCIDTTTVLANGATCDVNPSVPEVCLNGTCTACTAGVACDTNPDPCRTGTTSCATGTSVCVDSSTAEPNGTVCGTDQVCNGGSCTTCIANAPCQNPGSCYAGTTSCSTGTSVCVDGTTPLPNGTSCGASSICASGACVSVRTVSGSRLASYWTTTGTCSAAAPCKSDVVPDDVLGGTARVSARPAAGATWTEIAGTFSANGSFSIPNVPAGPYQLVLVDGRGVTHIVETDSSSVDLGYDVLGRRDATLAASPTHVTFDLSGLTAWLGGDEVEATAFDVDVFDVPVAGADVLTGQTTGGAIEDWGASSAGRALNLLTSTDVLYLHQLSTETGTDGVNAFAYQRTAVSAWRVGYPLTSGQPTTITAALAPVTDTGTITVSWAPQQFEALLAALGPAASPAPEAHRLLVETAPYALATAAPVAAYGTPQLFRMVRAAGGVSPVALASPVVYGRFLDVALASDWRRAEFAATVSYTATGATSPLAVLATVGRREPMSPAPPTPIVPALGPVQTPLVAGAPALGTIPATGPAPTISWSAPAIGLPTHYEVRIHELSADVSGATVSRLLAAFRLAGTSTSLALPTGLLGAGKTYFAEIIPYAIASDGFDVAPLRRTNVYSHATTLTSPFAP